MMWVLAATLAASMMSDRVRQIDVPRRPPAPIADAPNVTVTTYPIRGASGPALIADMDRKGPVMANGVRGVAKTEWRHSISWRNEGGRCLPQTVQLSWTITVTMPALAEDLEIGPLLRDRWRVHALQIEAFEYGRVERINAGMADMLAGMRSAEDCEGLAEAKRIGELAIAEASSRYDLETARARRGFRPLR